MLYIVVIDVNTSCGTNNERLFKNSPAIYSRLEPGMQVELLGYESLL